MEERERQEQMRLKREKLKANVQLKQGRVEADRKKRWKKIKGRSRKKKIKVIKIEKNELDKKRQALADKRKEDERIRKHREMKRIKEEEKKAAEMTQEVQDEFAKYKGKRGRKKKTTRI